MIKTKTCKALIVKDASGTMAVEDLPVPQPAPGALIAKVELAGICASDYYALEGKSIGDPTVREEFPRGVGHEMVGAIVEMGERVEGDALGQPVSEGDRIVALAWIPCGSCYYCNVLRKPTLCENRYIFGGRCDVFPHITGTLAQYIYLPAGSTFIRLTEKVSLKAALLASCPLRTVFHAVDLLTTHSITGSSILVQGAGSLGLMAVALARHGGAKTIIVIDEHANRLALAAQLGADETISLKQTPDPQERLRTVLRQTNNLGADVIFECSGENEAVVEGIEMLIRGGEYLLIGRPTGSSGSLSIGRIVSKGIKLIGVQSSDVKHLSASLEFMEKTYQQIPSYEKVVSHTFPLVQAKEALDTARTGSAIKVAVSPWPD